MPLSTRLSVSPRRNASSQRKTRLRSTLCLFPPGSACVLAELQACTAQQGLGPGVASLHQAQRLSLPSCRLAPYNKALVHAFPLSTRLIVTPRQDASSHRRTRLWSTLFLSLPLPASLLAESQARNHGQGLGPRFASLHQAHRVSSPSHGVLPRVNAWVHVLPLFTGLIVSPGRVAARTPGQGLGLRFDSLHQAQRVSSPSRGFAPQDKVWVHALPLSTRLSVSPPRVAGYLPLDKALVYVLPLSSRLNVSPHRVAG